jgi:sec-independent protein translocase protein TatA
VTFPQGPELIIILVIVILLFGAKKLPELGHSVGKSIKGFKAGMRDAGEEEAAGEPEPSAAEAADAPAAAEPR